MDDDLGLQLPVLFLYLLGGKVFYAKPKCRLEFCTCKGPEFKTPLLRDHLLLSLGVSEHHGNHDFSLRVQHL